MSARITTMVAVPLSLTSPLTDVDQKLADRKSGAKGKGKEAWKALRDAFDITTVGGLLHHYPRRYIDRSRIGPIKGLRPGDEATIIARVKRVSKRQTRQRKSMVTVLLYDGSGSLELNFFNQPWVATQYREGVELAVSGQVAIYRGKLQMSGFEVEVLREGDDTVHTGRITPVHPAADGITARTIRELVFKALEQLPVLEDPLPSELVADERLSSYDEALRKIHFPESDEDLAAAVERLKFDELFVLELGVAFRKHRLAAESRGVAHEPEVGLEERFFGALPFELTDAQQRAIAQIREAMLAPRPMNTLLQGDVGAGKTAVALHAAVLAIASGHQAAIMAPTEVLAGQHGRSISVLLEAMGAERFLDRPCSGSRQDDGQGSLLDADPAAATPPPSLTYGVLTGGVGAKDRTRLMDGIATGEVDLVVGTHALVQEGVAFHDLSLAIIDEQHRFGVHQRMALKQKAEIEPDVLIMTATPIPRTLALTYYGDLDVVILDALPKGRQPIQTRIVKSSAQRHGAEQLIRDEAAAGRQSFVVCAAIDEANRLEVKAAEQEAVRLATDVFPDLSVELLHGKMKPADKERVMAAFRGGEHDVLIATTVIEVGVDVPNATVMLIENAERFGLAQLHQLRGRIGRGAHRSYCFLVDHRGPDNLIAEARLDAMVRTTDGFELADEDLRLRGEGTLFDVRQSGMPDLKLARLAEDLDLVKRARARAFALVAADPKLSDHPELDQELRHRFADSIEWLFEA